MLERFQEKVRGRLRTWKEEEHRADGALEKMGSRNFSDAKVSRFVADSRKPLEKRSETKPRSLRRVAAFRPNQAPQVEEIAFPVRDDLTRV